MEFAQYQEKRLTISYSELNSMLDAFCQINF